MEYATWWLVASLMIGISAIGGALRSIRTNEDRKFMGTIAYLLCILYFLTNFIGSFFQPTEEIAWSILATVVIGLLMTFSGWVGWKLRRSQSAEHKHNRK